MYWNKGLRKTLYRVIERDQRERGTLWLGKIKNGEMYTALELEFTTLGFHLKKKKIVAQV